MVQTTQAQNDSFLSDIQKEGKATGKISLENFSEAIEKNASILNEEAAEAFRTKPEEEWPTMKMEIYCHDCQKIVTPGLGETLRGNPRTVCGVCGSKKISMGSHKALKSFYHIEEKKDD